MRISELAAETSVPIPTIKYYLREGLLGPGERTSATQADYDDRHVQRLRLVRALVDVAGLSIERTRAVLELVEGPPGSLTTVLQRAVAPGDAGPTPRSDALMRQLGWAIPEGAEALDGLERALHALESSGIEMGPDLVPAVAEAVDAVAKVEIDRIPTSSPTAAVAYSVLGTELNAAVILALRRVAHVRRTIERFGNVDD